MSETPDGIDFSPTPDGRATNETSKSPRDVLLAEAAAKLKEFGGPDGRLGFVGIAGDNDDLGFVHVVNPSSEEGKTENSLFIGPPGAMAQSTDVGISRVAGKTVVWGVETVFDEGEEMRFAHVVAYQGDRAQWGVAQLDASLNEEAAEDVIDEIVGDFEGSYEPSEQWGTLDVTSLPIPGQANT